MDPITAAILAGVATGAASGVTDVVTKQGITGAYHALKQLLNAKFGSQSDVAQAIEKVEAKPDSSARRTVLQEEIEASRANQDATLVAAAQELLAKFDALPNSQQVLQTVTGDANIVISGSGNIVTYQQAPTGEKKT